MTLGYFVTFVHETCSTLYCSEWLVSVHLTHLSSLGTSKSHPLHWLVGSSRYAIAAVCRLQQVVIVTTLPWYSFEHNVPSPLSFDALRKGTSLSASPRKGLVCRRERCGATVSRSRGGGTPSAHVARAQEGGGETLEAVRDKRGSVREIGAASVTARFHPAQRIHRGAAEYAGSGARRCFPVGVSLDWNPGILSVVKTIGASRLRVAPRYPRRLLRTTVAKQ